jgi:glycosyltransferase involved in cell wall biosynthesis
MEKPIIASNIGGQMKLIIDEKTGFLFESGNAKSLSQKILKYFKLDETH